MLDGVQQVNVIIQEIDNVKDLYQKFNQLPEGSIICFDVDKTIIHPASQLFSEDSKYKNIIDEIKKDKNKYPNFEQILSNWRMARTVRLVDDGWTDLINKLKIKYKVYGLTQMQTGKFGNIPSMEEWRYNELKSIGIEFAETFNNKKQSVFIKNPNDPEVNPAIFDRGFFYTGDYTKGQIMEYIIDQAKPAAIGFADDLIQQVQDVKSACDQNEVQNKVFIFTGAKKLLGKPDDKVAEFQIENLKKGVWIEDDIAFEKVYGKPNPNHEKGELQELKKTKILEH